VEGARQNEPSDEAIASWAEEDARPIAATARRSPFSGKVFDPRRLRIPNPPHYSYSPELPAKRVASHWTAFHEYMDARERFIHGAIDEQPAHAFDEEVWSPLYDIGEGSRRLRQLAESNEDLGQRRLDAYTAALVEELWDTWRVGLVGTFYDDESFVSYDFDGDPEPGSFGLRIWSVYAVDLSQYAIRKPEYLVNGVSSPAADERFVQDLFYPASWSWPRRRLRQRRPFPDAT
jgi:hypothetical protein